MILISELKTYGQSLVDRLAGLNSFHAVFDESHLSKKLRDLTTIEYPILVASYPVASISGKNTDNVENTTSIAWFVLAKPDQSGRTFNQEDDQYNTLQVLALQLQSQMLQDAGASSYNCHFVSKIQPSGGNILPENSLAGCEGWSLNVSYNA